MKLHNQDFAAFDARAAEGSAVARAIDNGRIIPSKRSRNQREGRFIGKAYGKHARVRTQMRWPVRSEFARAFENVKTALRLGGVRLIDSRL